MNRHFRPNIEMILGMAIILSASSIAWAQKLPALETLECTHDLSLPAWGPYSKVYAGISHIADVSQGLRFDLSVFPSESGKIPMVPEVFQARNKVFHPLIGLASYDFWTFRHDVGSNTEATVDISYLRLNDSARLIRMACNNNGSSGEEMDLHLVASMHFPNGNSKNYLFPATPVLPSGSAWFDMENYDSMDYVSDASEPRTIPDQIGPELKPGISSPGWSHRYLQDDGMIRGELRGNDWVSGSAIVVGRNPGDHLRMTFTAPESFADAALVFRSKAKIAEFKLTIDKQPPVTLNLAGSGNIELHVFKLGNLVKGVHKLDLSTLRGVAEMDGFALCEAADAGKVAFIKKEWHPKPLITRGPESNSILLKYGDTSLIYGLRWFYPQQELGSYTGSDMGQVFSAAREQVSSVTTNGYDHYTAISLPNIHVLPHSTRVVYAMVCVGTGVAVEEALESPEEKPAWETLYSAMQAKAVSQFDCLPDGEKYRFSQEVLGATILANVAFPMYGDRKFVRALTPGKCWDSFYTWDAGMIGIGLTELSLPMSVEQLNAYLYGPGSQSAFLHHGSLVPTQIYQFQEIWNRTQSRELLAYMYPRLRNYYQFISGHLPGSTLLQLSSNLLTPWDYFYNSGGWDDYPAQVYVHAKHLEGVCAPVITTAQAIRMAKILTQAARQLGLNDDIPGYSSDVNVFTSALQQNAWDPDSGYYSYVVHDRAGKPSGILRATNGENYNMGLDGVSPLAAGICTSEQQRRLLGHLKTEGELWSKVGLSTVDQRSSYFSKNGYWNGTVWYPHQWILWKTMLDLGESQFADKIALTGLDVWKAGVKNSHGTFEFCNIASGKAGGWPHFSGLSSPVLNFFAAYFRPGTLTGGFDLWINQSAFAANNRGCVAKFSLPEIVNGRKSCLLVCLDPSLEYHVKLNDQLASFRVLRPGSLCIDVPWTVCENDLSITPR